jgi:hypothetical protein
MLIREFIKRRQRERKCGHLTDFDAIYIPPFPFVSSYLSFQSMVNLITLAVGFEM